MSEIIVLAHARAKKGSEAALEKNVRLAINPTHAEKSCLKYAFHQSTEDPQVFVMIEKWTSMEALNQHLKTPHIVELFKKLPDLLEASMQIQTFYAVDEGSPAKLL